MDRHYNRSLSVKKATEKQPGRLFTVDQSLGAAWQYEFSNRTNTHKMDFEKRGCDCRIFKEPRL
jgi:hypothetical protein